MKRLEFLFDPVSESESCRNDFNASKSGVPQRGPETDGLGWANNVPMLTTKVRRLMFFSSQFSFIQYPTSVRRAFQALAGLMCKDARTAIEVTPLS